MAYSVLTELLQLSKAWMQGFFFRVVMSKWCVYLYRPETDMVLLSCRHVQCSVIVPQPCRAGTIGGAAGRLGRAAPGRGRRGGKWGTKRGWCH